MVALYWLLNLRFTYLNDEYKGNHITKVQLHMPVCAWLHTAVICACTSKTYVEDTDSSEKSSQPCQSSYGSRHFMKWALAKEKSLWYNWKVIKSSIEWSKIYCKRLAHVWLLRKMKGFVEKIAYRILCMSLCLWAMKKKSFQSIELLTIIRLNSLEFPISYREKNKNKKQKREEKKTLTRCHRGLWPWEAYAS
jgi:hypothetical protein